MPSVRLTVYFCVYFLSNLSAPARSIGPEQRLPDAAHPPEYAMNASASHPQQPDRNAQEQRPWLSALADGDVDAVQQACDAWRDDAQARADWHTYHLIGDVLRSDDLAVDPARDALFLSRLRQRLADEPVVLAPEPEQVVSRHRRAAWLVPVAAAAGVAAVAGVLVFTQAGSAGDAQPGGWAMNGPATAAPGVLAADATGNNGFITGAQPGTTGNANARLLRDARLDHYLEAHRGAMGAALVAPGGALRNAEVVLPAPEQR
jgi:sigma-E factor negative regulatory protein RseA